MEQTKTNLLTQVEAARRIGVSYRSFNTFVKRGYIPFAEKQEGKRKLISAAII
jgi:predicted site-specific integrase-resolvase